MFLWIHHRDLQKRSHWLLPHRQVSRSRLTDQATTQRHDCQGRTIRYFYTHATRTSLRLAGNIRSMPQPTRKRRILAAKVREIVTFALPHRIVQNGHQNSQQDETLKRKGTAFQWNQPDNQIVYWGKENDWNAIHGVEVWANRQKLPHFSGVQGDLFVRNQKEKTQWILLHD